MMVEEAADEANDPMFGASIKANTEYPSKSASTFTIAAESHKPTTCFNCGESHRIYVCPRFKAMNAGERNTAVRQKKLCTNCLYPGHYVKDCRSQGSCRICQHRHHTFLHVDGNQHGHINGAGRDSNVTTSRLRASSRYPERIR